MIYNKASMENTIIVNQKMRDSMQITDGILPSAHQQHIYNRPRREDRMCAVSLPPNLAV